MPPQKNHAAPCKVVAREHSSLGAQSSGNLALPCKVAITMSLVLRSKATPRTSQRLCRGGLSTTSIGRVHFNGQMMPQDRYTCGITDTKGGSTSAKAFKLAGKYCADPAVTFASPKSHSYVLMPPRIHCEEGPALCCSDGEGSIPRTSNRTQVSCVGG